MASKTLVPQGLAVIPREEPTPAALLGPTRSLESGQQLSSFTELKQGLKGRTLFAVNDSPLKLE
jgi:hypothetical protein